jgi:hypothetical protein
MIIQKTKMKAPTPAHMALKKWICVSFLISVEVITMAAPAITQNGDCETEEESRSGNIKEDIP